MMPENLRPPSRKKAAGLRLRMADATIPRMKKFLLAVAVLAAMRLGAAPVAEWAFDQTGNLRGWAANGHLKNVAVTNGALTCRTDGSDPIFDYRGPLGFKATPFQQLEIRLKADREGEAEFFWTGTTLGKFGGFDQTKTTDFKVIGDGQWHTYRLLPFWQAEGKIVRLRLDLFDGARFAVEFIRIIELPAPPPAVVPEFDFTQGAQNWQAVGDATTQPGAEGLRITAAADGFALAPPVRFSSEERTVVSIRMAVDKGRRATLCYASDAMPGLQRHSFSMEGDGQEHTYNLDLLAAKNWRGHIVALGLTPSEVPGAQARIQWLKVSGEPQGPAQLKVLSFAPVEALPRAGLPATLAARLLNTGGEPAKNLRAVLTLPGGVKALAVVQPTSLGVGEEAEFTWKLDVPQPVNGAATLALAAADGADGATARTALAFTPRLAVPQTGYVPEPKPVRGPFEVGVYYFPGWHTAERWQPLQGFPERRPVLGWYREGDPEVADWQIKWAVEHGITYFVYDWYWSQGARQLEHGLHDAYFKARYRHLLKFCLLWANHNPPKTSSLEDCRGVVRFWIENYFRRPEHLTVDGKPVMIIFSPHRLSEDLGTGKVKEALDVMRSECRAAGLPGLHLVACIGSAGQAKQCAAEGYDAVTTYTWPGLGRTTADMYAPFATLVPAYRKQWEHIRELAPLPLAPLPVCGGWDSRPWHGDNNLVRYGRTPELFKRHLQDAKEFLLQPASRGSKLLLVEAWNEWGEGSYIEPHREFGFGYLDAIREVFTSAPAQHDDVTPADAGLGPYDVPPPAPPKTAWDFAHGEAAWKDTMGLAEVGVRRGALAGRTNSRDPAFFSPAMQAKADKFSKICLRMKLTPAPGAQLNDRAQLFWRTSRLPESEAMSEVFAIHGDGQWHDYTLPVGANKRWRGLITGLRLDPCNQPGVQVEVESIRLQ
jgi:hypothetical protein